MAKVNEIPVGEHWAILEERSITIPGDERSRTAPGHGYPEHTENVISYTPFVTEQTFREELARRREDNRFAIVRGIHVTETFVPKIITAVEVING